MTTLGTTLPRPLFAGRAIRTTSAFDRGLLFAAAISLAVAIAELSIIALAAPGFAELGGLAASVP